MLTGFETGRIRPVCEQAVHLDLALLLKHGRTALFGFESEPHPCHRHCVSVHLAMRHGIGGAASMKENILIVVEFRLVSEEDKTGPHWEMQI